MRRPLLLDLFSCAGGAGFGYHLAGFDVVGVDINPQPNYPFDFHQGGALEFLIDRGHEFDAVHASPPCQHYANVTKWRGDQDDHPDLLPVTVEKLAASGMPYVVENVVGAPMRVDYLLCGSMFGLRVRRHRQFQTSWGYGFAPSQCQHRDDDFAFEHKNERAFADAMGCTWMTAKEGRQAVPPAYTEFLGRQLLEQVAERAA